MSMQLTKFLIIFLIFVISYKNGIFCSPIMHTFQFKNIKYGERIRKATESMRNCNAQNRMNPVCPNESNRDMSPEFVVAMAYVPWQQFGPLYDIEKGLMVGTIFPIPDSPQSYNSCGKSVQTPADKSAGTNEPDEPPTAF